MNLTREEVNMMNKIQLDIFKHFVDICRELNLTYYMVHGSLLGALRLADFIPYDDDIDVAMPRRDYEILMQNGPKLLPKYLFLQSYKTDSEYPLAFAKIRNSNTTFSQTIMRKLEINEGIYIDIFPIDNYPNTFLQQKWYSIKEKFYGIRISSRLFYKDKQPFWKKIIREVVQYIYPSWKQAVEARANLYTHLQNTDVVITVGGKPSERGISKKIFGTPLQLKFSDFNINCPEKTSKYLECIYGDYSNYNPMGKYINEDGTVRVSAEKFSTTKSFLSK